MRTSRLFLVGFAQVLGVSVLSAQTPSPVSSPPCTATFRQTAAAHETPPVLLWESELDRLAAGTSRALLTAPLDAGLRTSALASARGAQRRAAEARASGLDADVSAADVADAILEARDDLIRALPASVFESIDAEAATIERPRNYKVPGRQIRAGNSIHCVGVADLRTHRHLAPEALLWEFYFTHRAYIARNEAVPGRGLQSEVPVRRQQGDSYFRGFCSYPL